MAMFIGSGGVWKEVQPGTSVGSAGSWKELMAGYVGSAGSWKQFFQSILVDIIGGSLSAVNNDATATSSYRISTVGTEQEGVNGNFTSYNTWLLSGVATDYDVMMTMNSGTTFTGSSLSTWINLSATQTWNVADTTSSPAGNGVTGSATLQIRRTDNDTVIDSATVSLTATSLSSV